jgi:hypothetical protein
MTQTRPAAEAMAACRRGVSSGRQRSQCLRERWYSSTLHRCGDPFTTHKLPCTLCAVMLNFTPSAPQLVACTMYFTIEALDTIHCFQDVRLQDARSLWSLLGTSNK